MMEFNPSSIINEEFKPYAETVWNVAQKSTCMKTHHGVIIVHTNPKTKVCSIIGEGQNRTPPRVLGCCLRNDTGHCRRDALGGTTEARYYDSCRCVHAESVAILDALRRVNTLEGADCYLWSIDVSGNPRQSEPCEMCKKLLVENHFNRVITPERTFYVKDFVGRWE